MLKRRRAVVLALIFSCKLVAMDAWEILDTPQNWDMPDFNYVPMEDKENISEELPVINVEDYFQPLAENFDEDEKDLVPPGKTCSFKVFPTVNQFFLDN